MVSGYCGTRSLLADSKSHVGPFFHVATSIDNKIQSSEQFSPFWLESDDRNRSACVTGYGPSGDHHLAISFNLKFKLYSNWHRKNVKHFVYSTAINSSAELWIAFYNMQSISFAFEPAVDGFIGISLWNVSMYQNSTLFHEI